MEDKDQSKKVTFHKHEIVGAQQAYDIMNRLGFTRSECEHVSKLVRHHQFRFYEDSSDKTIKKWLQKLGKNWEDVFKVRLADRRANPNNKGKPDMPLETATLLTRCRQVSKSMVFPEQLYVKRADFFRLGVPRERHGELMSNLLAMVETNKIKNQKRSLERYILKNYSDRGVNDCNGDVDSNI